MAKIVRLSEPLMVGILYEGKKSATQRSVNVTASAHVATITPKQDGGFDIALTIVNLRFAGLTVGSISSITLINEATHKPIAKAACLDGTWNAATHGSPLAVKSTSFEGAGCAEELLSAVIAPYVEVNKVLAAAQKVQQKASSKAEKKPEPQADAAPAPTSSESEAVPA